MKSLAELTQYDVAMLRDEMRLGSVYALIVFCIGLLISVLFSLTMDQENMFFLFGIMAVSGLCMSVVVYYVVNYKIIMDIKSNQKELILDMVQEKRKVPISETGSDFMFIPILGNLFRKSRGQKMKSANRYFFIIKNVRYPVDEDIYNIVNAGDIVQRHCAKLSRTTFRFELVL